MRTANVTSLTSSRVGSFWETYVVAQDPVAQSHPAGVVEGPRVGIPQGHVTANEVLGGPGKALFAADFDESEHLVEILDVVGEDRELCVRELGHLAPLDGSEFDDVLCPKQVSCGTVVQTLVQGPFES